MTERQQPYLPGEGMTGSEPPLLPGIEFLRDQTVPVPVLPTVRPEPSILGFPAEFATDAGPARLDDESAPRFSRGDRVPGEAGTEQQVDPARQRADGEPAAFHLVILRRTERFGGLALGLAGVATAVGLWLPWWRGGATGLPLVRHAVTVSGSEIGDLGRSGFWQPLVVVLGGGVLFLVGLLLLVRRARTHRFAGVLALLATLAVAAGVVVPLADANWSTASFGPGMWLAVAVAGLGVLGSMKAMLTTPRVRVERR